MKPPHGLRSSVAAIRFRRIAPWATLIPAVLAAALLLFDSLCPPDLSRYHTRSTEVLDSQGRLLRAFTTPGGFWRFPARPDEVAPLYIAMLEAYEDRRFDWHPGVDPLALVRAIGQALVHGRVVSGASTLTMQTVRLLEPRPRTILSKLVEMLRALQLEWRYSKSEILSIYLTLAPFGGNIEGVRAASLAYFGREPREMTPAQAALLVVLPQAPNDLRPDERPQAAAAARAKVLARAVSAGLLTRRQADEAEATAVPRTRRALPFLAPHLAERLRRESPDQSVIRTTLDGSLQASLRPLVRRAAEAQGAEVSAALLVADLESGAVRAALSGADYFDRRRDGMVDLLQALRSPGSTLKPFVYGLAFDRLLAHPATVMDDRAQRWDFYAPQNFDREFRGEVTLATALQQSLNLPAVAVLDRVGPASFLAALDGVGVDPAFPPGAEPGGLPIVLGGLGLTLEDLARLYGAVGRHDGRPLPLHYRPEEKPAARPPLFGPVAGWYLRTILVDTPRPADQRADLRGHEARRIAFKTGTSYGRRDAWAIGTSGRWLVAAWVGRPDGRPCQGCVGIFAAAPLMFGAFDLLPADGGTDDPPPEGALTGPASSLPDRLQRFDRPPLHPRRDGVPPSIAFPPADAALPAEQAAAGLLLRVEGGNRPFRWLIDGRPLGGPVWRQQTAWRPDGAGWFALTVIDGNGRSDSARVFVAP